MIAATLGFAACSGSTLSDFQQNAPDPDFSLFTMVDPWESLEEILDTVLSEDVNVKLGDVADAYPDEFVDFLSMTREILQARDKYDPEDRLVIDNLMIELESMVGYLIDPGSRHYEDASIDSYYSQNGSGQDYLTGFYRFLDKISQGDANIGGDVTAMGHAVMKYILDNSNNREIQNTVQSLIDTINDPDFKGDFIDISKGLSKLLIRGDYPMWVESDGDLITDYDDMSGGTNTGMGNMVQGTVSLIQGLSKVMMYDPVAKEYLFDIIRESASLVSEDNAVKLEKLVCNLEDHFTKGGAVYESDEYNNPVDDAGVDDGIYVNAEMGNTLREMWPSVLKLLIGGDKPDYSVIHDAWGKSPLEYVVRKAADLKNLGIDFSSAEYTNRDVNGLLPLEKSVSEMFTKDGLGRDRKTDPEANDVSYVDHLLFALVGAYNFGYVTDTAPDTGEWPYSEYSNHNRGHGEVTGGIITTNDSMYSLTNGAFLLEGLNMHAYGLALDHRVEQADHIGRSINSFSNAQLADNKFFMGRDYPTMLLLPSICAGDAGIPNGGKGCKTPTSNTTTLGTGNEDMRTYYPKVSNGIGELNTSRLVMGFIARACWDGEGPYYHAPSSGETASFDYNSDNVNELFNVYYKPNGEVYALVHKPAAGEWVYLYPATGDDVEVPESIDDEELAKYGTTLQHDLYYKPVVPGSLKLKYSPIQQLAFTDSGDYYVSQTLTSPQPGSIRTLKLKEVSNIYNLWSPLEITVPVTDSDNGNGTGTLTCSVFNGTGTVNYNTGAVTFVLDEDLLDSLYNFNQSLSSDELYVYYDALVATDDGVGNITGVINGTINYGSGEISAVSSVAGNYTVLCDYEVAALAYNGKRERDRKYRDMWKSDYYLVERGDTKTYCRPPLHENGSLYVEGNTGLDKYKLVASDQTRAGQFTFNEKIAEEDVIRACDSQEEAMVRNFQWLMLEKKFTFVIPMWVEQLGLLDSANLVIIEGNGLLGLANATPGDVDGQWLYDTGNAGEGSVSTGRTPDYHDSHIPGDARIMAFVREHNLVASLGVNIDLVWNTILGRGHVLPDAVGANMPPIPRMAFLQKAIIPSNATGNTTYTDPLNNTTSWQESWDNRNRIFPVVVALAGALHDRTYYEASATGYDYNWTGSHKYPLKDLLGGLVPPLAKPMYRHFDDNGGRWVGRIDEGYDTSTEEDRLYYLTSIDPDNGGASVSDFLPRRGLRTLTSFLAENETKACDGLVPLLAEKSVVSKLLTMLQRMGDNNLQDGLYGNDTGDRHARHDLFSGLEQLATAVKTTKGEVVEYGWNDQGYNDNKWKWMFATGQNMNDEGEYEDFTDVRDVDIVLDDLIYGLVGHDYMNISGTEYEGKGLAALPDDSQRAVDERLTTTGLIVQDSLGNTPIPGSLVIGVEGESETAADDGSGVIVGDLVVGKGYINYNTGEIYCILDRDVMGDTPSDKKVQCSYTYDREWSDFYDAVADMEEFLSADGKYAILENLIHMMDGLFATQRDFTDQEVAGVLYTVGKLLAQYDTDSEQWVFQGEDDFSNNNLYMILTRYLPQIHEVIKDDTGYNYGVMMTLMAEMMKPDGLLEAVMDSVQCSAEYAQLLEELDDFLIVATTPGSSINNNLWNLLIELLEDMSGAVEDYYEGGDEGLRNLFEKYGFQFNG